MIPRPMKSRLLKYSLIAVGFLLLGGYWAFGYFFYNPFEGEYGFPLSTLVPRDVDYYVGKGSLFEDFDRDLTPVLAQQIAAKQQSDALLELESVREVLAAVDFDRRLQELNQNLDQAPIDIDLLEVFAGSGVALGGYFAPRPDAAPQWILVGRANWLGKLGLEAIAGGLVDMGQMGMLHTELETGFSLSGGNLKDPLYLYRHLDVIGIATDPKLITQMETFISQRGQDSFGQSAKYSDHRAKVQTADEDLDLYVDSPAMHASFGLSGAFPGGPDAGFAANVMGKLFSTSLVRDLLGTVVFGKGLTAHLTGSLTSDGMQPRQKRLFRQTGFEKQDILDMARLAPRDAGLFFMAQAPLNDLLTIMVENTEEATLELLEGPARDLWGYSDITPLLGDLSGAFGDRFAFFVRPNDYPEDTSPEAPLHNDAKVLAWAAIIELDDEGALENLRSHVHDNPSMFGLQGRDTASPAIFTNTTADNVQSLEYHSQLVPGTGHLATIVIHGTRGRQYFMISNHSRLLSRSYALYRGNDGASTLADENWFKSMVDGGLPAVDLVAWSNPAAIAEPMAEIASVDAGLDVALAIDWNIERPRIARLVLAEDFPNEKYGSVSPENAQAYELMVDEAVELFKRKFVRENQGQLERQYQRPYEAAAILRGAFLELDLDPKNFRIFQRLILLEDGEE